MGEKERERWREEEKGQARAKEKEEGEERLLQGKTEGRTAKMKEKAEREYEM